MLFKDILYKVAIEQVIGDTHIAIDALAFDSRKIVPNAIYVAIKGTVADGHHFIAQAVAKGATAVVGQTLPEKRALGITYVQVADSQKALAIMASNYYDNPSQNLQLVGITGTNGKTTIATLLYQLFKNAGYKVGLLSTVRVMVGDKQYPATHTTPDSLTINKYLSQMSEAGVAYCFMEVSSHGIDQKRTHGLVFSGGVFTNLSHDHLDYHRTFKAYRDVKKRFFDQLPRTAFALVNKDDKNGAVMLQNTKAKKVTYSLRSYADYRGQILESSLEGLLLRLNDQEVWTKLIGAFNAYNLTAIYATAELLGLQNRETLQLVSNLQNVSGRFQYFISEKKVTAIVDYAHTPDALQNVLETINTIRTNNETLITVVGCGGDRDKGKRPIMGDIAARLSNKVIFTSDNPRTEEPQKIIEDITKGVAAADYKKTLSITDRLQAIKTACQLAKAHDIVLIAGKGHETYQEIQGVRSDFDDYEIIKAELKKIEQ